jgi:hypothetical protein
MKHLVGKLLTEKVTFMGDEVEVKKLTVGQVMDLQKVIDKAANSEDNQAQLKLLCDIIKIAVVGAEELTDEDFDTFPVKELTGLSENIMRLSGLGNTEGN